MRKKQKRKIRGLGLALSLLLVLGSVPALADWTDTASSQEMTDVSEVLEDWMEPIPVEELVEGTYPVAVNCSSSMFKIDRAELTVSEGKAVAKFFMGRTGYLCVFPGTALEASKASEEERIGYEEEEDGTYTFTLPVEQLDAVTPCAAYSKRKEQWYERSLVFVSTSLPEEAFQGKRGTTASDLGLEDGDYLIEAVLSGGSGRTTIESPARLHVEEGQMVLTTVFSSPNYDYVLLGEERYEPVNEEGNSTFELPLPFLDTPVAIVADTVAMSKPHEISYTIQVDSKSLKAAADNG